MSRAALVVSGGGSRGAHAVGGLDYMVDAGLVPAGGFPFMSGTSVGAIICSGLAMYPPGDFGRAVAYVRKSWGAYIRETSDVWQLRWPLGVPALWNLSAGTDEPLKSTLAKLVDPGLVAVSGVDLRLSAVDLLSGTLRVYTAADLLRYGTDPVRASASFPAAFPPVEIDGRLETDGGARDVAPLGEAISAGCDRIVVFVSQNPYEIQAVPRNKLHNTLDVALRFVHIAVHEIIANDIRACQRINDMVERGWTTSECPYKRIDLDIIYPSRSLGDPLEFKADRIAEEMEQGYEDTRAYFEAKRGTP